MILFLLVASESFRFSFLFSFAARAVPHAEEISMYAKKNPTLNATGDGKEAAGNETPPPVPEWISWHEIGRSGANANVNVAYIHTATCLPKAKEISKSRK